MNSTLPTIEKYNWKTIRNLVKKIQPSLFQVIDEIDPPSNCCLYLARYPYGSLIADRGTFNLPNSKGEIVPINHSSISNNLREELGYSGTIPLGLVTENSIESFLQAKHRVIPASLKSVGELVSLWRVLEEDKFSYHLNWTISSGARSICMLPKITDTACHKSLKIKYDLKLPVPKELFSHWEIFTHISNHPNFSQPWMSELLFFSNEWFKYKKDKKWQGFFQYLLDKLWQASAFRRNQVIFDSAFSVAQENKNLKPNPYLADTVKHLVAIGKGAAPAFCPAINDMAAPIKGLQEVYLEDYGLKKYAPVIMHLHHYSSCEDRPIYYSFQMPTTTIFSPKSRKLSSVMTEMHELKHIMQALISETLEGNLGLEKTPLYHLAKNTAYEYYHSDKDKFFEILPITEIVKIGNLFTKTSINNDNYLFPEFGPFFRGCISISRIKK